MNNASTSSNCRSGCESGWTTYLDHLSDSVHDEGSLYNSNYYISENHYGDDNNYYQGEKEEGDYYEELGEDSSMASDASSGPPHDNDPNRFCGYSVSDEGKKLRNCARKEQKKATKKQQKRNKNLCLDDTASSSVFQSADGDEDNATGFSQDFSGDVQGIESTAKKRFGLFKSSAKGKAGSLLGRKTP